MAAINVLSRSHIKDMRELVDALKRGDEQAIADYHDVVAAGDDD